MAVSSSVVDDSASTSCAGDGLVLFEEVRSRHNKNNTNDNKPERIDVVIVSIEPRHCNPLLKELAHLLPLRSQLLAAGVVVDLSHLKRVRKAPPPLDDDDDGSPQRKRAKRPLSLLQVVLGTPASVAALDDDATHRLRSRYGRALNNHTNTLCSVPTRAADSKEELQRFNDVWPTIYFHLRTEEHGEETAALRPDELRAMAAGMRAAVADSGGAVLCRPDTGRVVSRSGAEDAVRRQAAPGGSRPHPLSTPVLWAIQGVSRQERAAALRKGMDDDGFKQGQYLCTGYDAYLTKEPGIFEAMALVHSRIRRVIFGISDTEQGGLGGMDTANSTHDAAADHNNTTAVHCLPGTNHHYRVFRLVPPSHSDDHSGDPCNSATITTTTNTVHAATADKNKGALASSDNREHQHQKESSSFTLWEACRKIHCNDAKQEGT